MTAQASTIGAGAVPTALRSIRHGLDQLSETAAWQLSDDELRAAVAAMEQARRVLDGQTLRLVAEAGGRGLPARSGHGRLSHWVREVVPTMSPRQAGATARRAEVLFSRAVASDLGPTRHAVLTGRVALDQSDVVASTMSALIPPICPAGTVDHAILGEAQAFLLDQAGVFDSSRLRRLAERLRDRLDPGADLRLARDESARDRVRAVSIHTDPSGMVHLAGALTPQCGAALTTALDAWSAPQPATDGTPDPRTGTQRRHDALQLLAERTVADPTLLPTTHGSPYRIVVSTTHETLTAALAGERPASTGPATLPDGSALSTTALAALACDAEVVPVVIDAVGNPLDVGDTQYAFPPRQRQAITVRDKHCTYPGCGAPPPWCHVHHIEYASNGGRTSVTNGTLLCGRHHRHVHRTQASADVIEGQVVWDTGPGRRAGPAVTRAHRTLDALVRRWRLRQTPPHTAC